jgi:hypothetical protein
MIPISWSQVNAWRLSQQYLLQRADRRKFLEVVRRLGGVQAQVMSAAEWALGARVDSLAPRDVQNALWHDRTLIKTWAMRGTLHLLVASDLPLYVAARSEQLLRQHRPPSYYKYHGVTPAELESIIEGIPNVLSDTPITREQLADTLAKRARKPKLRDLLRSGWGALLKPSALRGELCFGPNQGQNVTFVRPNKWLGDWKPIDAQSALKEIARRYLRAYGPATPDDFARWWGLEAGHAKKLFRSLGDEVERIDVMGWQAWALVSTLEELKSLKTAHVVRLLPQFDAYVLGISRDCEPILPKTHKTRVYRPQGWISAVVLVDGRMAGVWEYDFQNSRVALNFEMFMPVPARTRHGLRAEAKRLAEFLGAKIEVVDASQD